MRVIAVDELIAAIGGVPRGLSERFNSFSRVAIDSRKVQPGDLFWALAGSQHDGHNYVQKAIANGAPAAVVAAGGANTENVIEVPETLQALWKFSRAYRDTFDALIIGVTGSVGKTTTRRMIQSVLSARFHGIESPQNYNNEFGVPLSLLQLEDEHDFAVIELAAAHPGEIATLAEIARPEVGVITAIGPSHLDGFETIENILETKAALIESLPPEGFAVLNGDDRNLRRIAERASCPCTLVGEKKHNDVIAENVQVGNHGITFMSGGNGFEVPAIGRHHVNSALIAIAIGRQIGMTNDEINRGLQAFVPAPGRCELRTIGPWTVIDDTYNSNPVSMSAACRVLRDWTTENKRILLTGDMLALGSWTENFHQLLGEEVTRSKFDRVIAFGSQAGCVARSARKHGMDAGSLGATRDHDVAAMLLDLWLEPGDVILVKGSRGMKMETFISRLEQLARDRVAAQTESEHSHRKVA